MQWVCRNSLLLRPQKDSALYLPVAEIYVQLLQGFQCLPCVLRLARSYSSSFRSFLRDPRFVCPHPGHKGVVTSGHICLLAFHVCIIVFPISTTVHAAPCAQPVPRVPQPLLPPLWRVLGTLPSWPPPLPHFPCQERSNYTEISTEKDRLLLWHQRQGSCKSGAAAATASGHYAGYRGALTSTPHFAPSLPRCLGLYPCLGPIRCPSQWMGEQRPGEREDIVNQKMTHNTCSVNVLND